MCGSNIALPPLRQSFQGSVAGILLALFINIVCYYYFAKELCVCVVSVAVVGMIQNYFCLSVMGWQ